MDAFAQMLDRADCSGLSAHAPQVGDWLRLLTEARAERDTACINAQLLRNRLAECEARVESLLDQLAKLEAESDRRPQSFEARVADYWQRRTVAALTLESSLGRAPIGDPDE